MKTKTIRGTTIYLKAYCDFKLVRQSVKIVSVLYHFGIHWLKPCGENQLRGHSLTILSFIAIVSIWLIAYFRTGNCPALSVVPAVPWVDSISMKIPSLCFRPPI